MRSHRLNVLALSALAFVTAPALHAQQDGLVAFPNVYKVQFENEWVRLVRVRLPAPSDLAEHTHPPGVMLHVYFNDADPITFEHDGSPGSITRPSVAARSYRVGFNTPETHAVINRGRGESDFMRVELKTIGRESQRERVYAPPLANTTSAIAEVTNSQYRSIRITIAARATYEVAAGATEPALLLALTEGVAIEGSGDAPTLKIGQERFVAGGGRVVIRNSSDAPVQLLRVDFLTRPDPAR
jgi:hypothetical protein